MNFFGRQNFNTNNNVKQFNTNEFTNYTKMGRKTVEQVKEEMNQVKYGNFKEMQDARKTEIAPNPTNELNKAPDYRSRINNLRNIGRG